METIKNSIEEYLYLVIMAQIHDICGSWNIQVSHWPHSNLNAIVWRRECCLKQWRLLNLESHWPQWYGRWSVWEKEWTFKWRKSTTYVALETYKYRKMSFQIRTKIHKINLSQNEFCWISFWLEMSCVVLFEYNFTSKINNFDLLFKKKSRILIRNALQAGKTSNECVRCVCVCSFRTNDGKRI